MRSTLHRVGLAGAPLGSAAGICSAGACAATPAVVASPAIAAIIGGTAATLHIASGLVLAPVSLAFLIGTYRRHRWPAGLIVAGIGFALMLVHYVSHFAGGTTGDEKWMYGGTALLFAGAVLDWSAQRRTGRDKIAKEGLL